jgi:hypothetical protein
VIREIKNFGGLMYFFMKIKGWEEQKGENMHTA